MIWWQSALIGLGVGLVLMPIFVWVSKLFKNTIERRNIKRMIKAGQFLIPIDKKDYDYNGAWKNQIDPSLYEKDLKNLNDKVFNKVAQ